jgi:hypothetical protein
MKYDIQINPPKISDEAIAKHQDFDALMAKFNAPASDAGALKSTKKAVKATAKASPFKLLYWLAPLAAAASVALFWHFSGEKTGLMQGLNEPILALNAPLPNIEKSYSTFVLETAEKDTVLQYSSGSKISVPASAFVDKTGKAVKGKVDIQYREMHDAVDMFIAGVPQIAEKHKTAQAAAAVQIQGYQNGEPVYISQDKSLAIELHTLLPEEMPTQNLAVYVYQANNDSWQFQTADRVESKGAKAQKPNGEKPNGEKPNGNLTDSIVNPDAEGQYAQFLAQAEQKLPQPKAPVLQKMDVVDDRETFDIDFKVSDFPEFAALKNLLWAISDEKKSYQNVLTEREWEKMDIKRKEGDKYELVLTSPNKTVTLEITPVASNAQDAQKIYKQQLAAYQTAQDKRKEKVADLAQQLQKQVNNTTAPVVASETKGQKEIVHYFNVSKFGLWASANLNPNLGNTIKANFIDSKGATIALKEVFAADANSKIYFSLPSPKQGQLMHYAPNMQLWAIDDKQQLRRLQPAKSMGESQDFVAAAPAQIKDENQLRAYLDDSRSPN